MKNIFFFLETFAGCSQLTAWPCAESWPRHSLPPLSGSDTGPPRVGPGQEKLNVLTLEGGTSEGGKIGFINSLTKLIQYLISFHCHQKY